MADPLRANVRVIRTVLPQIPPALRAESALRVRSALRRGEAVAKTHAPVDTGFLRNNIGIEDRGTSGTLMSRANYSVYVNFGTRNMAARPFFDRGVAAMSKALPEGWVTVEQRLPRI